MYSDLDPHSDVDDFLRDFQASVRPVEVARRRESLRRHLATLMADVSILPADETADLMAEGA